MPLIISSSASIEIKPTDGTVWLWYAVPKLPNSPGLGNLGLGAGGGADYRSLGFNYATIPIVILAFSKSNLFCQNLGPLLVLGFRA